LRLGKARCCSPQAIDRLLIQGEGHFYHTCHTTVSGRIRNRVAAHMRPRYSGTDRIAVAPSARPRRVDARGAPRLSRCSAAEGQAIVVTIIGETGGTWSLARAPGRPGPPAARVRGGSIRARRRRHCLATAFTTRRGGDLLALIHVDGDGELGSAVTGRHGLRPRPKTAAATSAPLPPEREAGYR
jgi:hypothetical protein